MNKFSPGDLALVLRTIEPLQAGSVVELIEDFDAGDIITCTVDGGRFMSTARGWIVVAGPIRAAVSEKSLMPLRGEFHSDLQKAKEVMG